MIGLFLNLLDTQSEKDKFANLYDKYKNLLYWISYGKTKSSQDAEECVQETFFYVAKHFEKSVMSIQVKPRVILQQLSRDFRLIFIINQRNLITLILMITI